MHLHRRIKIQLAIFLVIALTAITIMVFHFMKLPAQLFGVGRYTVTVQLPRAGGLYATGNVTYRGTEVGRIEDVRLTDTGVDAMLSLKSGIDIPSDLEAEVHSQSAIGEQYIALVPRDGASRPLRNGDVISEVNTSVPPDINTLLSNANTGLQAIPNDNLKTLIDESYTAVGGLGPELSRIVRGTTDLSLAARKNLDPFLALVDSAQPVFDSQTNTSSEIQMWARHIADVTGSLETHDDSVAGFIDNGGPAAEEARQLIDRVQPTLPVLMANLTSVGKVAVTYHDNIEQLLVLLPHAVAAGQAGIMANRNTKQAYRGQYLSFNLNINLPPPCTTGFLPAQQRRVPSEVDYPERAPGDLYCRTPQDSPFNVRGVRNTPCAGNPAKRAPSARLCESDEQFVPLNDGYNWKGDPNATTTGQAIPDTGPAAVPPPPTAPAQQPPPLAVAEYDPATGEYTGPDGQQYRQADLARVAPTQRTWQTMLLPPN
ncbi:mammalian cell entry protein [Mycolicibacterium moriokaense]|uniref:Mammalian cell entry protein n=1 Tax=Mycolicibacterium moriokaense TaxID=39691 RepID=A0AAD1HDV1_9MYCO|nr:MlaD family protein [Mycolicibacterium moriokaense]MCV7038761.1 MCE family protein [Mycolicibacterium moriokaense]ORB25362.1 mammalian cell entry protein [Mycolicibacterium moriokaense]BBX03628.1 mammalian cell entry protein [Mycolicibacterium moriokaense]